MKLNRWEAATQATGLLHPERAYVRILRKSVTDRFEICEFKTRRVVAAGTSWEEALSRLRLHGPSNPTVPSFVPPTKDEHRGLLFLADSFSCHAAEGLGTGDPADDELARAAARWIRRIKGIR